MKTLLIQANGNNIRLSKYFKQPKYELYYNNKRIIDTIIENGKNVVDKMVFLWFQYLILTLNINSQSPFRTFVTQNFYFILYARISIFQGIIINRTTFFKFSKHKTFGNELLRFLNHTL